MAVSNNLLYVANSRSGLQIYRIDSPQSLVRLGGDTTSPYGEVLAIAVYDHFILLSGPASVPSRIFVVDVSNPAAPIQTTSLRVPSPVLDIAMMGHYAVFTGGGMAAYVADFRDPAKPAQVGTFEIGSGAGYQIARLGTYLYVAMAGQLRVLRLQLGEPL